jgi:magnesium-transporting ATPase (P-type)
MRCCSSNSLPRSVFVCISSLCDIRVIVLVHRSGNGPPRPSQFERLRPTAMSFLGRPTAGAPVYMTYFMMLYVFGCWDSERASLFQTGWFVESLLTQTLIIHLIRTNRIPLLQSRASWPLIVTTAIVMMVGVWLPFSPLGPARPQSLSRTMQPEMTGSLFAGGGLMARHRGSPIRGQRHRPPLSNSLMWPQKFRLLRGRTLA